MENLREYQTKLRVLKCFSSKSFLGTQTIKRRYCLPLSSSQYNFYPHRKWQRGAWGWWPGQAHTRCRMTPWERGRGGAPVQSPDHGPDHQTQRSSYPRSHYLLRNNSFSLQWKSDINWCISTSKIRFRFGRSSSWLKSIWIRKSFWTSCQTYFPNHTFKGFHHCKDLNTYALSIYSRWIFKSDSINIFRYNKQMKHIASVSLSLMLYFHLWLGWAGSR